jgi:hypothetical protein
MSSAHALAGKKKEILKHWFQATVDSYPADTARFLKNQTDPFANPVGQTTYRSLEALVDALISGAGDQAMKAALDPVIRIRAVQSFTPSKATAFVFALKGIVREQLTDTVGETDMAALDWRIDGMAMMAFDVFMACREKVYELKASESRNQFFGSLKRAGLIDETEADGSGS